MRWRVVAVVTLAIISGCTGALDEEPISPVTPADVPTLAPESVEFPDGLDENGLTSVLTVAEGHTRALGDQSYAWEVRKCREYVRNGTVVGEDCGADNITYVDETTYRWNHTAGPDSEDIPQFEPSAMEDSYVNGTTVFRRSETSKRVWYESERATVEHVDFSFTAERIVQLYLSVNESSVQRVERDGRTVYRVVGTDHRIPGYSRGNDYRVVAFVDQSGFVHELRASYNSTHGELTARTTLHSEYRDVGEATVEPPSWIDAARENVSVDG